MNAQREQAPLLRRLAPLLFLGLTGLAAVLLLLKDISPAASVDFRLSRSAIMDKSSDFMHALGYGLAGLHQDAWFQFDSKTDLYLQQRHGMRTSNAMLRADSIPAHAWLVTWYDRHLSQSQNTEHFTLWMSPGGRVIGFDHAISDTTSLPSLGAGEARAFAESLLVRHHPDFDRYRLTTSSDIKQLHRTDHQFLYSKESEGMELTLSARVQGNEMGAMQWNDVLEGAFLGEYSNAATGMTLGGTLSIAATFLLFFFIVVLFLKKYHEGEVGIRTAVMVFLGILGVSLLAALNEITVLGANTGIADLNKYYVRIIVFILDIFIFQVFLGVLVFAAWSVGESSSRAVWPKKLVATDSVLFRRFLTQDIGESVLRGYGWGFLILGLHALLAAALVRNGFPLFVSSMGGVPESSIPGVQPVLYGLGAAVFGEVVDRLFFLSWLRERFGKLWPAMLVSVSVWTVTALFMWGMPFGSPSLALHLVLLAAYGLVFAFLFMRYDLMTAMTAHVVIVATSIAIPLLTSTGPSFVASRFVLGAVLAIPPLLGVIGCLRRERFEFNPATLPTHIQRISERVRMAKELEIARSVQMSLLPREQPRLQGYDIAGICIPAEEVGGDYFDFVRLGSHKLGIALGDVSGKGVPAAIYMTLTKGILQSNAEENIRPKAVLSKVNSLMYRTIERNSFVSMLYAVLDCEQRSFRFARAGQCPVILAQDAGGEGIILTPPGMALGLEKGEVFDAVLEERELPLREGEILVFYTDGFTEAMNDREDEFGEHQLLEAVARHRHGTATELIHGICRDVRVFTGSAPQHDDMTMVVVKVLPQQEEPRPQPQA
jgi:sigma-B regulation protein RsbU (phosphoserine phosphatase)